MPTSRRLPPLLALLLAGMAHPALAASDANAPTPEAFARMRPGVVSSGPASAPRRHDSMVEPVLFQSVGVERPIEEPAPVPVDAQPQAASIPPPLDQAAEPVRLETAPAKAPTEAPPRAPLTTKVEPEGRALGNRAPANKPSAASTPTENPLATLMQWRPSSRTLTTTGAGLAIAIGLLMSFTWLLRSLAPKSSRPLPRDVVEVLGRAPLGGKQTTQLVRVGSKLVLVAITPEGAETLTEITDPDEVARLIAACDAKRGDGSAAEFDQLLQQMSGERATPGFLDRAANEDVEASFDPRSLAAAYANTPGGRGDG